MLIGCQGQGFIQCNQTVSCLEEVQDYIPVTETTHNTNIQVYSL